MLILRLSLVAWLLGAAVRPADEPRRFSVEDLRQDFTLLREALEELHPSLNWYTPAVELDRAFDAAASTSG